MNPGIILPIRNRPAPETAMSRLVRRCAVSLLLCLTLGFTAGCPSPSGPQPTLADANSAYARGDFEQAYSFASAIASGDPSEASDEAAYLAGLAAGELGNTQKAIRYLKQAGEGFDAELAADANVMLGLAYSSQQRYDLAATALLSAAQTLEGEDRAKAYFYAAVAGQKLGRWATARDHLTLARAASADPAFRQQVEEQLAVNGYTLQIGSFVESATAQQTAEQLTPKAEAIGLGEPRLLPNPARPGQTLVHLGRFSTFNSAAAYRAQLGVPGAFIVPIAMEKAR
jgi:tetratricopeptide (TPR) repeat protein